MISNCRSIAKRSISFYRAQERVIKHLASLTPQMLQGPSPSAPYRSQVGSQKLIVQKLKKDFYALPDHSVMLAALLPDASHELDPEQIFTHVEEFLGPSYLLLLLSRFFGLMHYLMLTSEAPESSQERAAKMEHLLHYLATLTPETVLAHGSLAAAYATDDAQLIVAALQDRFHARQDAATLIAPFVPPETLGILVSEGISFQVVFDFVASELEPLHLHLLLAKHMALFEGISYVQLGLLHGRSKSQVAQVRRAEKRVVAALQKLTPAALRLFLGGG